MTDERRLWVSTASGGREVLAVLEQMLSVNDPWWSASMIAPWNTEVGTTVPRGGIDDTDWGIVANSERSVRWRNESGRLAFSMVSETDPGIDDVVESTAVEVSRIDYLVEERYRAGVGASWIREIRYDGIDGSSIRYELLREGPT